MRKLLTSLFALLIVGTAMAQYDDIYFVPGDEELTVASVERTSPSSKSVDTYENYSDYYYTNQIRRFYNPVAGYSNVYTRAGNRYNSSYYNTGSNYYNTGSTVYRATNWGGGYNSVGSTYGSAYNSACPNNSYSSTRTVNNTGFTPTTTRNTNYVRGARTTGSSNVGTRGTVRRTKTTTNTRRTYSPRSTTRSSSTRSTTPSSRSKAGSIGRSSTTKSSSTRSGGRR